MERVDLQTPSNTCTALVADPSMSRRAFLFSGAVVGALTFLGGAHGGRILAYADEQGSTHFVINVVSREDMCVVAVNASSGNLVPLGGLNIGITSEANGKQVSGATDKTGVVVLNVRQLSPLADNDFQDSYAFWGSVVAGGVAGMRDVEIKRAYMQSGLGSLQEDGTRQPWLQIATQNHDNKPYLVSCSLNGIDVQYLPCSMALGSLNDAVQTLEVDFKQLKAGEVVTAQLQTAAGKVIASGQASAWSSGLATVTLKGTWFNGTIFDSLETQLQLQFGISDGTYILPLKVSFFEPILPLGVTTPSDLSFSLSSGIIKPSDAKKESALPDWLASTNDSFSLSVPGFPISLVSEPLKGRIGIAATFFTFSKATKDGKWKDGEWKTIGDNFGKGAFNDGWDKMKEKVKNASLARADKENSDSRFGSAPATKKWEFTYTVSALGLGNWYHYTDKSTGKDLGYTTNVDLALKLCATLQGTYSRQFVVGPVPLVLTGDVSFSLTSITSLNMQFADSLALKNMCLKAGDDGQSEVIDLYFEAGVGLAVGIDSVVSVGVRGFGYFDFMTTFFEDGHPSLPVGKSNPRLEISIGAGLQVNVQLLFFKKTYTLIKTDPDNLYDSWNTSSLSASGESKGEYAFLNSGFDDAQPLESGGLQANGNDFEMMSDSALLGVSEFSMALGSFGASTNSVFTREMQAQDPEAIPNIVPLNASGSAYAPVQGIKPSYCEKVLDSVFSDGRPRVVTLNGEDYLFRIAVVTMQIEDTSSYQMIQDSTGELFISATTAGFAAAPRVKANEDGSLLYCEQEYIDGLPVAKLIASTQIQNATPQLAGNESALQAAPFEEARTLVERINAGDGDAGMLKEHRLSSKVTVPRGRLTVARRIKEGAKAGQWGEPEVIDFVVPDSRTQFMRANTWDADFDVLVAEDKIHVALDCMVRPMDESKTLSNQERMQFAAYMVYDPTSPKESQIDNVYVTLLDRYKDGFEKSWGPRLTTAYTQGVPRVVLTYQRITSSQSSSGQTAYRTDFIDILFNARTGLFYSEEYLFNGYDGWVDTCDMALSSTGRITGNNNSDIIVALCNPNSDNGEVPHTDIRYVCLREGTQTTTLENVTSVTKVEDGFLYAKQTGEANLKQLMHITYSPRAYSETGDGFVCEALGSANVLDFCANEEGSKLYAVRITEGTFDGASETACQAYQEGAKTNFSNPQPTLSNANEQSLVNGGAPVPVQMYQILEAQYVSEHDSFQEFYPLAQLDFAPDSMQLESQTNSDIFFLMSHVTSSSALSADLLRVAVPRVLGMELLDAKSVELVCGVGETMHVMVTVRNVGNMPISGFSLKIAGDADAGSQDMLFNSVITDLSRYVTYGLDNYRQVLDSQGEPTGQWDLEMDAIDSAGIVWPGKERSFCIPVTIPKGWDGGDHTVVAVAQNPRAWETNFLTATDMHVIELEGTSTEATFTCSGSALLGDNSVAYNSLECESADYVDASGKQSLRKVIGVKAVRKSGRKIRVSWKTKRGIADGASGYQVAHKKKGSKKWSSVIVKGADTSSKIIKGLNKEETYCVRVREYRKKNGKTTYGPWSDVCKG